MSICRALLFCLLIMSDEWIDRLVLLVNESASFMFVTRSCRVIVRFSTGEIICHGSYGQTGTKSNTHHQLTTENPQMFVIYTFIEMKASIDHNHSNKDDDDSVEHRMTTLFLLAQGKIPSWKAKRGTTVLTPSMSSSDINPEDHHTVNHVSHIPKVRIILYLWIISVCCKVLLFPSYKSTDFFVHRHWKALTYQRNQLSILLWYADHEYIPPKQPSLQGIVDTNRNNIPSIIHHNPTETVLQTVHTLDYPPGFAWLEYMMVNNFIVDVGWLDPANANTDHNDPCLKLMDDSIAYTSISNRCISYMRTTVIIFADILYWIGAYVVATSIRYCTVTTTTTPSSTGPTASTPTAIGPTTVSQHPTTRVAILLFLFLVFHPTLLWLDHIHFQYNGTMIGILLISLGCLLHANNSYPNNFGHRTNGTRPTSNVRMNHGVLWKEHYYHWIATIMFGILLTLKHLYITNSLWFVIYLFRRYCCCMMDTPTTTDRRTSTSSNNKRRTKIMWHRLLLLFVMGGISVLVPFAPFLLALYYDTTTLPAATYQERLQIWLLQLYHRLFPFGRGLVHTYWAGNVWALYTAVDKVWNFVVAFLNTDSTSIRFHLPPPSSISPGVTVIGIVLAQLPGLKMVWNAARTQSNVLLLQSFVLTSLGTFLLQYHAHEKAILTALIPCTIWYATIISQPSDHSTQNPSVTASLSTQNSTIQAGSILWDFTACSILGLFPLLYQSQELWIKVGSTILYLSTLSLWCHDVMIPTSVAFVDQNPTASVWGKVHRMITNGNTTKTVVLFLIVTIVQLEIPYRWFWGKYEFMPLATTSLVCAVGFIWTYTRLLLFCFKKYGE
jgi:alpha-1,3-glucosyltransferase